MHTNKILFQIITYREGEKLESELIKESLTNIRHHDYQIPDMETYSEGLILIWHHHTWIMAPILSSTTLHENITHRHFGRAGKSISFSSFFGSSGFSQVYILRPGISDT